MVRIPAPEAPARRILIKHMAKRMQRGGVILSMSSLTGLMTAEGYAAYGGAKAGLNHVTRIAAAEYAPEGIRVHALARVSSRHQWRQASSPWMP